MSLMRFKPKTFTSTFQSANHCARVAVDDAYVHTCERGLDQLLVALLITVLSFLEHDDEQDHLHHGPESGIQYGTHCKTTLR